MKRNLIKYFMLGMVAVFYLNAFCIGQTEKIRPANWAVKINSTSLGNLYRLNDSIYRSEQPRKKAFQDLSVMGIKSVLNLRNDFSDSDLLSSTTIQGFRVSMKGGHFSDAEIVAALKILLSAPKPLLVHCKHGADRTGVVIAMYRMIFEGWTKQMALDELLNGGYHFHRRYKNIPVYINRVNLAAIKKQVLADTVSTDR
ncbi:tyrosine-protein phosphatase [Ferruginibacter paludis]|uniref:phosphatase domain-containing putative toxin n=1 Tax=Ferruginibacter paludis TaxID=1310417 RepID=UPI0025B39B48|nr:tyrosine-protein phosphatase [Ferruginibacter paludis]MDN3656484.1 tyrosine-protein phosphatase [Ferruginibacter paludis]